MIKAIIVTCYLAGVALWQYPLLYRGMMILRSRFIIRRNLKDATDNTRFRRYGRLASHIKLAVEGAGMEKTFRSPEAFFWISAVMAAGTTGIVLMAENLSMALCCGTFAGMLPYGLVMMRLHDQRINRSREGDVMVSELLNNYKIYGFNIKEAVEVTAASLTGAPNARKLLLNLAKGMNTAVTRNEVASILDVFRYSLDTAWGNVLASNIMFAHVDGMRIDSALEDLSLSISRSREVIEHGKRENNEARLILKYLAPISFFLSVFGACRFFGFTIEKYLRYQFGTSIGIKWLLIMIMCYGAGIFINSFFSREKMDI
jgi:hypothetical protein